MTAAKTKMKMTTGEILSDIKKSLGLKNQQDELKEAYVTQAKKFNLPTELISSKVKRARQEDFERFVETLNEISAKLDTASRESANEHSSEFRSLKVDETHCLNAAFLRAIHFENISDLQSQLTMDSIPFMRLQRDFGTFDDWQKDFVACAMSARSGYALTGYNTFLRRYMNYVIDEESKNVPIGVHPVIALDVSEGSYFRDYMNDRKTYVFAMMKELDWEVIEKRFKRAEKISKVIEG